MNPSALLDVIRATVPDAVHRYTHGDCYRLYLLLKAVFPDAAPWYDRHAGHVLTAILGRLWDINGERWAVGHVPEYVVPWADLEDWIKADAPNWEWVPPQHADGVVAEYIAARDAYEDATRPTSSHGHSRSLKHGDPVLLRYRAARAALAAQDEAMVESPLVPVSSADIEAACRHACRLQSINPDQKWLRGCEETNWQRIQGTVGAALHHYAVGLRNKLWNGKPLTEIAAAKAAALPAVPPDADDSMVVIETVGLVREREDGSRYIDWTLEGGIHGMEVGDELTATSRQVTNDEGYGEVYQRPQAALPAVPDGWQPIDTIPKDERRVELLSANGKTDRGNWAARPDWLGQTDDVQDYLNTDNGEGDYTHWREIAATPAHDQPAEPA